MLADVANGIDAADGAGTWIHTLVIDTGERFSAIGVNVAFWLAARFRITQISGQARAHSPII